MRKALFVVSLVLIFLSSVSADHKTGHNPPFQVGDNEVKYSASGSDNRLRIDCKNGRDCIDSIVDVRYRIYVSCHGWRYWRNIGDTSNDKVTNQATSGDDTDYIFNKLVPNDIPCGLGENLRVNFTIWDRALASPGGWELEEHGLGTLDIEPNDMDANKGKYIYLGWKVKSGSTDHLKEFFLSNEAWYDNDGEGLSADFDEYPDRDNGQAVEDGAFILAKENDGAIPDKDDDGVINARYGMIIEPEEDLTVGSVEDPDGNGHVNMHKYEEPDSSDGCTQPDCWIAGNDPIELAKVFNKDFGDYKERYWNGKLKGDPNFNPGSITPLAVPPMDSNGRFEPEGEIIAASPISRNNFYSNPVGGERLNQRSDVRFYVCRGDYRGDTISNSKKVRVHDLVGQGLENQWKYYRCNMNNDWVEIECPPGMELDDTGSGLECNVKPTETLNVDYFDIEGLKTDDAQSRFITGFRIDRSEMNKFESLFERPPNHIDAECWMGSNDRKPTDSSKKTMFELDYDSDASGPVWVLGQMPYRENVNNGTYSCVWGFSDYDSSMPNLWEGTQHEPLRSIDRGKITVDYDTLQTEYSNLENNNRVHYSPNIWNGYWGTQRDEYTSEYEEHPFRSPIVEHPYCPGNEGSSEATLGINQIICS